MSYALTFARLRVARICLRCARRLMTFAERLMDGAA